MAQDEKNYKLKFTVVQDEHFIDLNLYQFGWEKCEPLHSFGPYIRNHYLFHYVISGKGVLKANEQEYAISAGSGFLILSQANHQLYRGSAGALGIRLDRI